MMQVEIEKQKKLSELNTFKKQNSSKKQVVIPESKFRNKLLKASELNSMQVQNDVSNDVSSSSFGSIDQSELADRVDYIDSGHRLERPADATKQAVKELEHMHSL